MVIKYKDLRLVAENVYTNPLDKTGVLLIGYRMHEKLNNSILEDVKSSKCVLQKKT